MARSSTKIAVGFLALTVGGYFAREFISDRMIMGEKFSVLTPGKVNLVGIDPGAGYRIIVANSIAQLVETSGDFSGAGDDQGGATEGAIKKRMPMRELLQTLQGNSEALGRFAMALNDMKEDDTWPTTRVVWKSEDIQKALDAPGPLRTKLEDALNVRLDGTPLPRINFDSFENGIIVDTPVTVTVNLNGKPTEVVGRVQEPYRPRLVKATEEAYKDKGDVTRVIQAGYYRDQAEKVLKNPRDRENVADSLRDRIAPNLSKQRAEAPDRVLKYATIVVTDAFVEGASYRGYDGEDGKRRFDLSVRLNDEGRKRLWQFSKKRVGTQLLLVADGIPIAAPRIQHELSQGELTITQMPDEVLVREAVDLLNQKKVALR